MYLDLGTVLNRCNQEKIFCCPMEQLISLMLMDTFLELVQYINGNMAHSSKVIVL